MHFKAIQKDKYHYISFMCKERKAQTGEGYKPPYLPAAVYKWGS